jgi:hypothetical protein
MDMVDRVALALNDAMIKHGDYKPDELARAAIAAMREPTESMRRKLWLYGNHPDKEFVMDGGMWREMIDAELECSTKPDEK